MELKVLEIPRDGVATFDVRNFRRIRRTASGEIVAELVPAALAAKIVATAAASSADGEPVLVAQKYVAAKDREVA